jgi:hypothetical protein
MRSGSTTSTSLAAAALLAALAALVGGCGGDGEESPVPDLAAALPDDNELGPGWVRISEPRQAAEAEASTLCDVDLNDGMVEGAKIDHADAQENGASMFFRRYESADAASEALREASELIAGCPPNALGGGVSFSVEVLPAPDAGDEASAAVFTIPETPQTLAEQFGWTLVRTGDVVRSLQYTPASPGGGVAADLDMLARAVGATR